MKKVLSAILTIAMLMTCVFSTFTMPVSAATDVTLDASSLESVITFLDEYMPDSANKRIEAYEILSTYLSTDSGIDTLTGVLDGTVDPVPAPIQKIMTALSGEGADVNSIKDEFIFALNLVKGLNDAVVLKGFEDFEEFRAETEANGGVEEEAIDAQEELNELYEKLLGATGREKLATHNVGPNSIIMLVAKFRGYILLTDDVVGGDDFAVAEVSDSYDDSVFDYIDTLNGKAVADAEDVFEILIDAVNSHYTAEEKTILKTVLGEIGIYKPLTEETEEPTAEPTKRPSSSKDYFSGTLLPDKPVEIPDKIEDLEEVTHGFTIDAPQMGTTSFSDTTTHWGNNYITQLADAGIFTGYPAGNFEPDLGITREEMAVVLVRALGAENRLGTVALKGYTDVAEIAEWARDYIALATELGIFEGYSDGYYKPKRVISREELCAIIIRAMESDGNKVLLNYADRSSFADWSTPYIGKASYHGIVSGYPDGEFKTTQQVTRAEAAKMIYNFMQVR